MAGRRCVGIGLVGARFGCAWPAGPGCPPASTLITNGSTFTRPPVRALQLGLSSVPRVDPRVPRSLDEYCSIYREWLLLLRGRLQQQVCFPRARDAGRALGAVPGKGSWRACRPWRAGTDWSQVQPDPGLADARPRAAHTHGRSHWSSPPRSLTTPITSSCATHCATACCRCALLYM